MPQLTAHSHCTLTLHNQTPDPAGTSVTLKPSLILVRLTAGIPGPQGGISIRYCTAASPVPAHWRKAGKWKVKSANTTALESAWILSYFITQHRSLLSTLDSRLSRLSTALSSNIATKKLHFVNPLKHCKVSQSEVARQKSDGGVILHQILNQH